MIVYYKNDEIDREQWDNCINNSDYAKPYAFSWCLDIMSPGWEALIDDDYDAVFPIPARSRLGIKFVVTPPFLQQLGVYSPDKRPMDIISEFLDYMPDFFRFTDLCIGQKVDHHQYRVTEKSNFELDLSSPYNELENGYTPECRKFIQKASGKKFEPAEDIAPEELTGICREYGRLNQKNVEISDLERTERLMNYCLSAGKGSIVGVRTSGKKPVYGVFLLQMHGSLVILLEANSAESFDKHLGYLVINEVIRQNASKHLILDFSGTSENYMIPAGMFFGGKKISYYRIYRNKLFWPAGILR